MGGLRVTDTHLEDVPIRQEQDVDDVIVVFGFNDSDWYARLPGQYIVSKLLLFLVARRHVAAHDDRVGGKRHLALDLRHQLPACLIDGRRDEQIADIGLAEFFLLFAIHQVDPSLNGLWLVIIASSVYESVLNLNKL